MSQISNELKILDQTEFAYDFETNGLKYMDEGFFVRCVSFHNDQVSISVELSDSSGNYYQGASALFKWISEQQGLIAHNAQFESGVLFAMTGKYTPHKACTYMMLSRLANEGSPGQSWGLKKCGQELLGWDDWSVGIPKSAEMSYLPFDQLGWYNQVDSAATWELYKTCHLAIQQHHDTWGQHFLQYLKDDAQSHLLQQFEAYTNGLRIDSEYTENYNREVLVSVDELEQVFLNHKDIKPWIEKFNNNAIEKAWQEVRAYDKKLKKDGEPTLNYLKKLKWFEGVKLDTHFNINSPPQLQHLLFQCLKLEPRLLTDAGSPSTKKAALQEMPIYGKMILDYRNKISQYKFLRACLENKQGDELRINVKVPGTLTGRCSSGSVE